MKTLNINAKEGFSTEIEAIQFWNFDDCYSANVAVKCGDSGIVLICLYGDKKKALVRWPQDVLWSEEDKAFQTYVESEFTSAEFFKCLEENNGLKNKRSYLEENGESMN